MDPNEDLAATEEVNLNPTVEEVSQLIQDLKRESDNLSIYIKNRDLESVKNTAAFMAMSLPDIDLALQTLEDPQKETLKAQYENIKIKHAAIQESVSLATAVIHPPTYLIQPATTAETPANQMKIKPISLPTFGGDIEEWCTWWELYQIGVHNNTLYKDGATKFAYLKNLLKNEARLCVEGVDATDAGYRSAIEDLCRRFGDPAKLTAAYYNKLSKMTPSHDPTGQRGNLDNVKKILKNLEGQGAQIDQDNLKSTILGKFSRDTIRWCLWQLIKFGEDPKEERSYTVEQMVTALEKAVSLEELVEMYFQQAQKVGIKGDNGPLMALMNIDTNPNQGPSTPRQRSCVFCASTQHKTLECGLFPTRDKRVGKLSELKLCFLCCSPKHRANSCNLREAACPQCTRVGHQKILCPLYLKSRSSAGHDTRTANGKAGQGQKHTGTFIQTFECQIKISNKYIKVRGVLDTGSRTSFVQSSLLDRLNLQNKITNPIDLPICTFGKNTARKIKSGEIELTLTNMAQTTLKTFTFRTTPIITSPCETSPSSDLVKQILPDNIPYADQSIFEDAWQPIELLIGVNLNYEILTGKIVRLPVSKIVLLESMFGWIPSGEIDSNVSTYPPPHTSTLLCTPETESDRFEQDRDGIDRLWSLEAVGIRAKELDSDEDKVLANFQNTFQFVDKRYTVRWPWKHAKPRLPTNFKMCMARLKNLVISKKPAELIKYDEVIKEQMQNGVVELAPKKPQNPTAIHYLPHNSIEKGDKIRIVYDASAKTPGNNSLNDEIYAGPNLIQDSVGLLINFRLNPIALIADIEKAFLQIRLNLNDRDSVRWLWLKDPLKPVTMDNLLFLRFTSIPFGVIASPFLLQICLQDLFARPPQNHFIDMIRKKFYADNLVLSVERMIDAVNIHDILMERMKSASFNLRDWKSNDLETLRALKLPTDDLHENVSVLGYNWNRQDDTLSLKFDRIHPPPIITKRVALSFLAAIYDPCGFFSPLLLPLKKFMQTCWQHKLDWNDPFPPSLHTEWEKLYYDIFEIGTITIPRRVWTFPEGSVVNLHMFCDASADAYACVAYLVYVNNITGQFTSTLVYSKLRVAPLKPLSIPRLELLALLIGKRSTNFLIDKYDLKFNQIVIWSDATTPLQWLNSKSPLPQFVQTRVNELKSIPNVSYRHVPGNVNPADIPTKEIKFEAFRDSQLWLRGPEWLPHERAWPIPPPNTEIVTTGMGIMMLAVNDKPDKSNLDNQPKFKGPFTDEFEKKLSSWDAYVRVVRGFMMLGNPQFRNSPKILTYRLAEQKLAQKLQEKYFPDELRLLKAKFQPDPRLNLFLDKNGLIRCKGRIGNAHFPYDTINPILLPRESNLTMLFIHKIHSENLHMGVSYTLAKIRERFWIKKGRSAVKYVIHRCPTCRRVDGGSYQLPQMPDLPNVRITTDAPFMYTGTDFLGPVFIKNDSNEVVKAYIAIFVCLVTRAIHLEAVRDLSADKFLIALENFSNRRGCPKFLISDNATNFVFVQPLVGEECKFSNTAIKRYLSNNVIQWKFIPKYAPWHGGAYERLVGLVKSCLKKCYRIDFLHYDEFVNALIKIEKILNGRPLTYVPDEVLRPLTPNWFLLPARAANIDETVEVNENKLNELDSKRIKLVKSLKNTYEVLENFWSLFRSQYLYSLRERHTVNHKTVKNSLPYIPRKGEVVLVKEPSAPRAMWKLGVILSVDKSQRTANVKCKEKISIRAINQLYPLELPDDKFVDNSKAPTSKPRKYLNKPLPTRNQTYQLPMNQLQKRSAKNPPAPPPPNAKKQRTQ